MTEKGYRQKIVARCKGIGTYRQEFDWIIDMLAELYVRRDLTKEQYKQSGESIIIEQTNKSGNKYTTKNPYLAEIDNCEQRILELEKELGLTPLAKKKIDGAVLDNKQGSNDPVAAAITGLRLVKS